MQCSHESSNTSDVAVFVPSLPAQLGKICLLMLIANVHPPMDAIKWEQFGKS